MESQFQPPYAISCLHSTLRFDSSMQAETSITSTHETGCEIAMQMV
jgi:hypothetical protein